MEFKETDLYISAVVMLLIAVLSFGYWSLGTEIGRINEDRTINRVMATQVMFQYEVDQRFKIETLLFAIKGMEGRGEDTTAVEKYRNQCIVDFQKLEADYDFFMKQNKPIRSIFPPFQKVFPELRDNAHMLLYKLKEN